MVSLYDKVTEWMSVQQGKHDLGETYVEDTVNAMSNDELLRAISNALEEMKEAA